MRFILQRNKVTIVRHKLRITTKKVKIPRYKHGNVRKSIVEYKPGIARNKVRLAKREKVSYEELQKSLNCEIKSFSISLITLLFCGGNKLPRFSVLAELV